MKREVHGRNVLIAKHHSIVGQKKIVTMVEEGLNVQLCIENMRGGLVHRSEFLSFSFLFSSAFTSKTVFTIFGFFH